MRSPAQVSSLRVRMFWPRLGAAGGSEDRFRSHVQTGVFGEADPGLSLFHTREREERTGQSVYQIKEEGTSLSLLLCLSTPPPGLIPPPRLIDDFYQIID